MPLRQRRVLAVRTNVPVLVLLLGRRKRKMPHVLRLRLRCCCHDFYRSPRCLWMASSLQVLSVPLQWCLPHSPPLPPMSLPPVKMMLALSGTRYLGDSRHCCCASKTHFEPHRCWCCRPRTQLGTKGCERCRKGCGRGVSLLLVLLLLPILQHWFYFCRRGC